MLVVIILFMLHLGKGSTFGLPSLFDRFLSEPIEGIPADDVMPDVGETPSLDGEIPAIEDPGVTNTIYGHEYTGTVEQARKFV